MSLDRIKFVLLHTQHPGNIGAAARAMKTMSLRRLVLVNPRDYPNADATARASGADDILAAAEVVAHFHDAIADCQLVMGLSARSRKIPWPGFAAREAAQLAWQVSAQAQVAVVFGPERMGLTNEELERCHYHVHIPANADYSSLNLAAAVQIVAYELQLAGSLPETAEDTELGADAATMERFFEHLQQTLRDVGFLTEDEPSAKLHRRLRRLFLRAKPDIHEISMLRGILTAAQKSAK